MAALSWASSGEANSVRGSNSTWMSGSMPCLIVEPLPNHRSAGLNPRLAVILVKPPSGTLGMNFWPSLLPKVLVPIIVAILWSCSAPTTSSEADAEAPVNSAENGHPKR